MIINPNLYVGKRVTNISPSGTPYRSLNLVINTVVPNLIKGKTYTWSFDIEQDESGSGGISVGIFSDKGKLIESKEYKVDSKISYTFAYNPEIHKGLLAYTDRAGMTQNIGAIFKNIKVEEGNQATTYIPNSKTLAPSKQAIFVAGGVFHEVYPV